MKNKFTLEIIVSTVLVCLLVLTVNPFNIFMPDMFEMMIGIVALIVFAFFAAFVVREKVVDEREEAHRSLAGRYSFIVGATTLIIGIIVQLFEHNVDNWLVVSLIVMIITKLSIRIYTEIRL